MSISVVQGFEAVESIKRNIANVTPADRVRMANTVNSQIYAQAMHVNPDDYRVDYTIQTAANVARYALPLDFMNIDVAKTGLFKTSTGSTYVILNISSLSGAIAVGETIDGDSSLATGTVQEVGTDFLVLYGITGAFEDGEDITASGSETATLDSSVLFDRNKNRYNLTEYGSFEEGYYFESSNLIKTPPSTSSNTGVDVLRYIPRLDLFVVPSPDTDPIAGDFVDIPYSEGDYLELITDLLLIQYEVKDRNDGQWEVAQLRAFNVIQDFFGKVNKKPRIFSI